MQCFFYTLIIIRIGNAMLNGRLAALQAIECMRTKNTSSQFMKEYYDAIWHTLGDELKLRTRTQKIIKMAPLILHLGFRLTSREPVRRLMQSKC